MDPRAATVALLLGLIAGHALAQDAATPLPAASQRLDARDSLGPLREERDAARAMLAGFWYEPQPFALEVRPRADDEPGDCASIVTFPSPRPTGDALLDRVALEWFPARGRAVPPRAPAVLLLHILDGRLLLERAVARALSVQGVHAFVLHLPGYQSRRLPGPRPDLLVMLARARQGIADARRARDAIAALPAVDAERISLVGISLGGILGTSVAALDGCFRHQFLFLAGGDLRGVLRDGEREIAAMREQIRRSGLADTDVAAALDACDPLTVAHRLDRARTFLFSADADEVVPPANARALGRAAGLEGGHHVWFRGTHHSGVLQLPEFVARMLAEIRRER